MMRFSAHQQSCEVVGPDEPIVFVWSGIIDPEDVGTLFEAARKHVASESPRLLWDMSATHLVPGETRRRFLDELVRWKVGAVAVVTSSFYVRVPITMILEVAALDIEGRPPFRFFDEPGSGRAWLSSLTPKGESS